MKPITEGKEASDKESILKKNPENIKYLKRRAVKLWCTHGMEYDAVIKSNAKGGKRYILT